MSAEEPPAHRIRLRGPWEVRAIAPRVPGDFPPTRMTIPCALRGGGWTGYAGRVSFYRRFGRPSNLSADESVWLVFEAVAGETDVTLNDVHLGTVGGTGAFDVTSRLADRNGLTVTVDAADDAGGIVGDVVIEIRRGLTPPPGAPGPRLSRPGE
jgi:hypothetical protein